MSTGTDPKRDFDFDFDDGFDLHAAMARWNAAQGDAADRVLDLYQKTVGRLAEAHVTRAQATDNPAIVTLAETQANLSRDVADAYIRSVRKLLEH